MPGPWREGGEAGETCLSARPPGPGRAQLIWDASIPEWPLQGGGGVSGRRFWNSGWAFPTSVTAQFSSIAQSCPTLCHSMDCSLPGLPDPTERQVSREEGWERGRESPRGSENSCPSRACPPALESPQVLSVN